MSLFNRFFGKKDEVTAEARPVANPDSQQGLSLQVVFAGSNPLNPQHLQATLQAAGVEALVEIDPQTAQQGTPLGLVSWDKHMVKLVGFDAPMPSEVVESCVAPAHYPAVLKEQVRRHHSHLLLFYAGYETTTLEQYVALALVAASLTSQGALAVLNESARTSLASEILSAITASGNATEELRQLPILMLYSGFVKYDLPNSPQVWMRTYGNYYFNVPDFAVLTEGHHQGQQTFDLLSSVISYLIESGATLATGHTMQVGGDIFMRLRAPGAAESALEDGHPLLLAEFIPASAINK